MEASDALIEAGILTRAPDPLLAEWIRASGATGESLVALARAEGIADDTFDALACRLLVRGASGSAYALIDSPTGARALAELTELLAGGRPSAARGRRDANRWSYADLGRLGTGDLGLMLALGAAVATTPEGTLLVVPRRGRHLPNLASLFAVSGGTTWGELFVLNEPSPDPAAELRRWIARDDEPLGSGTTLRRLLRHERIHSEQWARHGFAGFVAAYLWASATEGRRNRFEREAGLADGGYGADG